MSRAGLLRRSIPHNFRALSLPVLLARVHKLRGLVGAVVGTRFPEARPRDEAAAFVRPDWPELPPQLLGPTQISGAAPHSRQAPQVPVSLSTQLRIASISFNMGDLLTQLQDAVNQVGWALHLHICRARDANIISERQLAQQFVASIYFVNRHHDLEKLGRTTRSESSSPKRTSERVVLLSDRLLAPPHPPS